MECKLKVFRRNGFSQIGFRQKGIRQNGRLSSLTVIALKKAH
jgi:hypothetical protein